MDQTVLIVIVLVAGLLAGGLLGWFVGSRPVTELRQRWLVRDREARELDEKFKAAIRDLAGASERARLADELSGQLSAVRGERDALAGELATLKANAAHFEEQKKLLVEAREELLREFQNTGSAVLGKAQEAFLKAASERFGHAEKASEEKIRALLEPVGKKLESYEKQVSELEAKRVDAFGQLFGQIDAMRAGAEAVKAEAARLGNSLRNAPKARGRWGEQQLKNVLEQCGLSEHTDFVTERSVETEDGRLRPDAIVRIPGNKLLVIDAKVSLNAYQDAFHSEDELQRETFLAQHAKSMQTHIQTLGAKSYQSQFVEAPDYVLMFVPGEHFIAAALEYDPGLWDYAFERRVLLASPTNLVAIARTIAQVWRQDGLAREAREIGRMGGELYDRLAKVTDDLGKLGTHLTRAVSSYNDFTKSFDSRVLVSARRLKEKHIEIGKREIEDVPQIEAAPRYNASDLLSAPEDGDGEQSTQNAAQ